MLTRFADTLFPGFTMKREQMAAQLSGIWRLDIAVARMNRLRLKLARPFWPLGRSLL